MDIDQSRYAIVREVPGLLYDIAVEVVKDELSAEGFRIMGEIDIRAVLKKNFDEDFRPYVVLSACNPKLARSAFTSEPLIGVLLPCSVVVIKRDGGGTYVAATDPEAAFELVDNEEMETLAEEIRNRLEAAFRRL